MAVLSRALHTHLKVMQCAALSWWSCKSCHHHPKCAEHPGFPTLPHHMSVHCSQQNPSQSWPRAAQLWSRISLQWHCFRESITLSDSYFSYFDCENLLQNTCSLHENMFIANDKIEIKSSISQYVIIHGAEVFRQCANATAWNCFSSLNFQNCH